MWVVVAASTVKTTLLIRKKRRGYIILYKCPGRAFASLLFGFNDVDWDDHILEETTLPTYS
jgi:hypothetical protein